MTLATKQPNRAHNRPKTAQKSKVGRDYEDFSPNVVKNQDYAQYVNFRVSQEQLSTIKSPLRGSTIEVDQKKASPIRLSRTLARDIHSPLRASGEIKT